MLKKRITYPLVDDFKASSINDVLMKVPSFLDYEDLKKQIFEQLRANADVLKPSGPLSATGAITIASRSPKKRDEEIRLNVLIRYFIMDKKFAVEIS